FVGIAAAVPGAGALLSLVLGRFGAVPRRAGIADGLFVAALAFLAGEGLVLPLFGQGIFAVSYDGDPLAIHVPFAIASGAYGLVLVGLVRGVQRPNAQAAAS